MRRPFPSPAMSGCRAVKAAEEPGGLLAPARLVGADRVCALQRDTDVVEAFEQPLLAVAVHVEGPLAAVRRDHALRAQVSALPWKGQ